MKLTINVITRGRPQLVVETVKHTLDLIREPSTTLMVSVDDDDTDTERALAPFLDRVWLSVKPREDSLGAKWNRALDCAADVYLPLGDYGLITTPGFDERILEVASDLPDNIGVICNHLCCASFPYFQAVTAGMVAHTGYIYPPYFPYWFIDHWMQDLALLIGRYPFVDVKMDNSRRQATQELRQFYFWSAFYDAGKLHRRQLAKRIVESPSFIEPDWRKRDCLRRYPNIEWVSEYINDIGRKESGFEDGPPGGERYLRIKARALDLMHDWQADQQKAA